ncbi:MAG: hypothetical protein LBC78_04335 [Oscillospiraceae bacterium]|jgi:hypothetical protein|nr:hypothetical protein [Oscillospiraceae bacterium]
MLDNEIQTGAACPAVGTHYAGVAVPVTVKPFAIPGPVCVKCCGEPTMSAEERCRGKVGGVCHFVIAQKIRIDVPIDFGASVKVGETFVDCDHFAIETNLNAPGKPIFPNAPAPNLPNAPEMPNMPNAPAMPQIPPMSNLPDNYPCGCK